MDVYEKKKKKEMPKLKQIPSDKQQNEVDIKVEDSEANEISFYVFAFKPIKEKFCFQRGLLR